MEVERAKMSWVDVDNQVLRIPKEESNKSAENWVVGVTERTAKALDRWLDEREMYENRERRNSVSFDQNGGSAASREGGGGPH